MKKRLWAVVLVGLFLTLAVTGCWGKREVEDLGFVLAIGVDQGDNPDQYDVTYQMAIPKKGAQGPDMQDLTITTTGISIRGSLEKVFTLSSRQPFVGTVKILVIGEEAAKQGINKFLDFFQRYYEFRRTTYLVMTRGKAQDLLNIKIRAEKFPALVLQAYMNQKEMTSTFPVVRLGHYLTVLATGSTAPVIPVVSTVKPGEADIKYKPEQEGAPEELRIAGVGVFNGDKLAGYLSEQETRGYMWLRNEAQQRFLCTELDDGGEHYFTSGRVTATSTKMKLEKSNGSYGMHYTVNFTGDVDEFSWKPEKRTPEQWYQDAAGITKSAFEKLVRSECEAAVSRSKEMDLDFLGVGRLIEEKDPAYWHQIKDRWQARLPEFPVTVDVDYHPENAGGSFNPPVNPPGTGT